MSVERTLILDMPARARSSAERRALEDLSSRCAAAGFRIAYDLLGCAADAEDAVQEALAIACEKHARLRDAQALRRWFYQVLTRHCLRQLRRRRVGRALGVRYQLPFSDGPSQTPRADSAMVEGESTRALLSALEQLPSRQKIAVVLRYGHAMPVADVAEAMRVRLATAKTHLSRGLERLRELLEERDG